MSRGKFEDLTGQHFGRARVIRRAKQEPGAQVSWVCRCRCGKKFVAEGRYLKSGKTKSCGCANKKSTEFGMTKSEMRRGVDNLDDILRSADEEPYQKLADAIVAVAADDYRTALKGKNDKLKASLEKFFHSNWYKTLTNVDGDILIALLQKEHTASLAAANT